MAQEMHSAGKDEIIGKRKLHTSRIEREGGLKEGSGRRTGEGDLGKKYNKV